MKGPIVERPAMLLRGTGLSSDIDNEHFILRRNVSAQKRLKSSQWMRITSRSGEFFTDEQRAIFIGKAHATTPQVSIDSDIFELSVDQDRESALARGNVVLKNRDRVGHAEMAHLELGGSQIVLEGKARIDSKDNEIRGRRIMLYTDDDRIEVDEAEGKVAK
jgi:lipopolysaccharide transport protein LptA